MSRIVLVVGTGRCGLASLVTVLAKQSGANVSLENLPLLPWKRAQGDRVIRERFARFRKQREAEVIVDVASFYLPYLEDAILSELDIRIIALKRPCEETVTSFGRFLDGYNIFPTNHWAEKPGVGWSHDLIWTRTFPQYPTAERAEGIRLYWGEYYQRLERLEERFPQNLRIFDMHESLNSESGQRSLLEFAGFATERQVLGIGAKAQRVKPSTGRPPVRRPSNHPLDPARCVVLVPFTGSVYPQCEVGLRELEKRGYCVRRVGGFAAIDQGRNQLATDALIDGFEETMWIDSDIDFNADSVDQLRAHGLPITCGIYAQKRFRALSSHIFPGTPKVTFGRNGGLYEVQYAATGFFLVRREVYMKIQHQLSLPLANERFSGKMIPFFHPMVHPFEDGHWYLAEDFAFSERARQCGFKIVADTTLRLWHIGNYAYGWEEAGMDKERRDSLTLHFPEKHP